MKDAPPCAVPDCPTLAVSAGGHCAVHAAIAPTAGLLEGDLFALLPTIAANSIDAVVVDPPYGIGFMGREWDTFKPGTGKHRKLMHPREREAQRIISDNPNIHGRLRSPALSPSQIEYDFSAKGLRGFQDWTARWAAQVHRVMKPGAYIVVCGAPRSHHRMMCGLEDAGFVVRDCFAWLFGSGFPKNKNLGDGRGTALKPAHEPIALAWKPFKGTIAGNLATFGTGALNIEDCEITNASDPLERWPANVLLDPTAAAALEEQIADVSRFYYCAKPSREERDEGCEGMAAASAGEATRRKEGSAGLNSPRAGAGRTGGARNSHPTVKPVALMRWLIRLVTPPGGVVLDCFAGSGTTGMAAALEQRQFLGIEKEPAYAEIARRRIAAAVPLFGEPDPPAAATDPVEEQRSLYD